MRKRMALISGLMFTVSLANAQSLKKAGKEMEVPATINKINVNKYINDTGGKVTLRAACSKQVALQNPDLFPIDSTTIYLSGGSGAWGYVTGHNNYNDSAKVEKFNVSLLGIDTFNLEALSAIIVWGMNSTADPDPEIGILVVASDQTTVLHFDTIDLNNPPASVNLTNLGGNFYLLTYQFATPITITSDFYAGLTFFYGGNQDTVGILSTTINDNYTNVAADNTAFEIWSNSTFMDIKQAWDFPFSFNMHIIAVGTANVSTPLTDSFSVTPNTLCYDSLGTMNIVATPNVYSGHIYRVDIIFNKSDGTADTTSTTAVDFEGYAITIDSIENGENVGFVFQSVCGGPYTVTITDTCPTIISAPVPSSSMPNVKVWANPDKIFISSPEEITVSLYSMDGKEVKTMRLTGTKYIEVSTAGTYILKIDNGKASKTLKIRVE